jgi:hypothetical protein
MKAFTTFLPFDKGRLGGIFRAAANQIPLDPPFSKGETNEPEELSDIYYDSAGQNLREVLS